MSFTADLKVSGQTYPILSSSFSLDQQVDSKGKVSSHVRGGTISVQLASTGDTTLFDLASDDDKRVDGSIVFYKDDGKSTMKELKFKNAYVVGYVESFVTYNNTTDESNLPMNVSVSFSAETITLGDVEFNNNWVK
ncbi:MAG TPA: type VI secretion system tube protein TssD [Niabella sp.]|nr:type VI secretion system tube protein TssD [Niabella sp.]HQW14733.1 type VI secretion system tube protein TssD [Niabella sp.]HQX20015.1 type VI secretion system tube protein TssD [Niabella sp.]HQX40635.1 type VI secretion system tube protein TssD [Niabella sp.]HRB08074.1 type VI secretion system tube protein TssD [Niabella sp.]